MSNKLITFMVPCYNSETYMSRCIDSLLTAGERAEILIVDDGSTDRTGKIAVLYQKRYQEICRVLTQENGGHGAGINHGLKEARRRYFKVVDSDDWLDEAALIQFIAQLENLEISGGVDQMVTNYVYDDIDPSLTHTIRYRNVFPQGRIFVWDETRRFLPWQYLCMHVTTYRTQLLRDCGIHLPEHTFYEDNLFAYLPLKKVRRLAYLNVDLYHYSIGRKDQSVEENMLKKNCEHQILVSTRIFQSCDPKDLKMEEPRLADYLWHALVFFLILAIVFTRLNNSSEADQMVQNMWVALKKENKQLARKLRFRSLALFVSFPGAVGRRFAILCYRIAHKFVAFN